MRASKLISAGRKYLLSRRGITETIIDNHLSQWRRNKKNTLKAIFRSMLDTAKNKGGMPNYIGDIENLAGVLFEFHPDKVTSHYSTWQAVFDDIQKKKVKVPGRMQRDNPRNSWVIYTKAIISCAQFLSSFKNAQEFHKFVGAFYTNEHSKLALPLLLKQEIFGFGFALACDFLKENGYPEFIKPDTHIKDIVRAVGITRADSDYGVFKDVVAYCAENGLVPYEFDKLLWLIGSGNFYLNHLSVRTNKWEFIESVR